MARINKKSIKKAALKLMLLLGTFTAFGGMSYSMAATSDWIKTFVNLGSLYMDQYFSMVHFSVGGNDFGGGILWLPILQTGTTATEIKINGNSGDKKFCASQVRGFYWNSQRGDSRIWPLDQETHNWLTGSEKNLPANQKKYTGLILTGGWYTNCAEDETGALNMQNGLSTGDSFGIYGSISYYYSGSNADPINLVAGIGYDAQTNRMLSGSASKFTCSLQRLNNSYPFGYIYDDYGHIGLVGARVISGVIQSETEYQKAMNFHNGLSSILNNPTACTGNDNTPRACCMNDVFSYDGENLRYNKNDCEMQDCSKGKEIPGFTCTGDPVLCLKNLLAWGQGTPASTTVFTLGIKGIVGLTDEVTDAQKQYYENNQFQTTLLLRTESSISNIVNSTNRIAERLCRGRWSSGSIGTSQTLKDLTCLSGTSSEITLNASQLAGKTLILKGANLRLNNDFSTPNKPINLFIDKGNLFLNNTGTLQTFDSYGYLTGSCTDCAKAFYLKGNFIINGLLLGGLDGMGVFKNRLYIHGKLISYNTLTIPSETRISTINKIVPKSTTPAYGNYSGVALMNLFKWSCDTIAGTGSDNTWCKGNASTDNRDAQLVDKAFGLIDMNIDSVFSTTD